MRAVGIVRVSKTAGREGQSFVSPREQRRRIEDACKRDGLELVEVHEELDVSGGTALERREGLRAAVEAIEDSAVEVIVVAYFDRLVRSLRVQSEVLARVEAAGGRVLAVDIGEVSEATATQWVSSTVLGMVAEYHRRATRERAGEAQADAVARGVMPWPRIPPGYRKGEDGVLVADADTREVVDEGFQLRADGETIATVREHLRLGGVERSYHGVQSLLGSRVYLGEIHFGKLVNLEAHEPIVDREVWEQVQRVKVIRGRRPKSDRLLARLGVLVCGNCGARMVVGTQAWKHYPFYRCPPAGDCTRRVTIGAEIAEKVVSDEVRRVLADAEGRASAETDAREAVEVMEKAQADLDSAIRVLVGMADETAAMERLAELRRGRDEAVERADQLGGLRSALTIRVVEDWDRLTLDERRALIQATVERAKVGPGRGPSRITVELVGE